jgi:3-deoxy-D-manno-octulosonate 8-phosphate phosphatase (KDO 8-P phosphatase)
MMKLILTDVDGVLTDGRVLLDVHGNENKRICYRDLDAIGIGRRAGYEFGIITGEDTPMARMIAKRFGVTIAHFGAKDKVKTMDIIEKETGTSVGNIVYIGDSDNDVGLLKLAGLSFAPPDATFRAKDAANIVTDSKGGEGILLEVVDKLILQKLQWPGERKA